MHQGTETPFAMKFSEVLDLSRSNFPIKDYGGQFIDYGQLRTVLSLFQKLPKGVNVTYKNQSSSSVDTLFFAALDTEISKVSRHFKAVEARVKRSWRILQGLETQPDEVPYQPKSVLDADKHNDEVFELIPETHLGQAAKYCWQYSKLNAAALLRACNDYDTMYHKHKGKVYVEACRTGSRKPHAAFLSNVATEELKAIARMYGGAGGQDPTSDIAAINMALLDCSFSAAWMPDADYDPYHCPECKRVMTQPVGLACNHIICYRCYRHSMATKTKPISVPRAMGFGVAMVAKPADESSVKKLCCPVCKTRGAFVGATNLQALAASNKQRGAAESASAGSALSSHSSMQHPSGCSDWEITGSPQQEAAKLRRHSPMKGGAPPSPSRMQHVAGRTPGKA